ncbi:hypothetical protein BMS3Bbin02_01458 [bacterium BMS3Bbin02]|nr:hypothetical protein BMS3Bbin02_01458 [bacterium BMS3Bbin02]
MKTTRQTSVVIGIGELGGVFAKALLVMGHTVVPVLRDTPIEDVATRHPDPEVVVAAVGEGDLDDVLAALPASWRTKVCLIQNELLPRSWEPYRLLDPTVAVVWFEKKAGRPVTPIIPTPIAGPAASLLVEGLRKIGVPAREVSAAAQVTEMVRKNLYILVANIAGLKVGGTVGELWAVHNALARAVGDEILAIQSWLVGTPLDSESLYAGMVEAFDADPDHGTTGRSAPVRLARAVAYARQAGLETPTLDRLRETFGGNA